MELNTKEAASKISAAGFRIDSIQVAKLAKKGVFPSAEKDDTDRWLITSSDIDNYIQTQRKTQNRNKISWITGGTVIAVLSLIFALISALGDILQMKNDYLTTQERGFNLRLQTSNIEGYQTASLAKISRMQFPSGLKFKLALQNISENSLEVEGLSIVITKYLPPEKPVGQIPNLDSMKFGDVKRINQVFVNIWPDNIEASWILPERQKPAIVKPSNHNNSNLLLLSDNSSMIISVKPSETEWIEGVIKAQEPGTYEFHIEMNHLTPTGEIATASTESMVIICDTQVESQEGDLYSTPLSTEGLPSIVSEPFVDSTPDPSEENEVLGPVGLDQIGLVYNLLLGEKALVLVNENYGFTVESPYADINIASPSLIFETLEKIIADDNPATLWLSDGVTNHVVAAQKTSMEGDEMRVYYIDSWYSESFLEFGKNIANVSARSEQDGVFSITYEEFSRVIVAIEYLILS